MSQFFQRVFQRVFGSFIEKRTERLLNSRRMQQEFDIQRLYLLTQFREELERCQSEGKPLPEKMTVVNPEDLPSLEMQMDHVQETVSKQLVRILGAVHESYDGTHEQIAQDNFLQSQLGFAVQKRSSTVQGAGHGLFMKGNTLPGTVVGFHPGIVYLLLDLNRMPNYPKVDRDNPYLFSRFDGAVLDAKGWSILLQRDPNHPRYSDVTSHYVDHPFAYGHLINHPPKDVRPNVMPYSFDVPVKFPSHLIRYIPNVYYRKPGLLNFSEECIIKTIVFVTRRTISDGEELFVDYRYNPKNKYPDWYHPIDEKENNRRWTR